MDDGNNVREDDGFFDFRAVTRAGDRKNAVIEEERESVIIHGTYRWWSCTRRCIASSNTARPQLKRK